MGLFGALRSKTQTEDPCKSWIFLSFPEEISWDGPRKKRWVAQYLDSLEWVIVVNDANKRFICPQCSKV